MVLCRLFTRDINRALLVPYPYTHDIHVTHIQAALKGCSCRAGPTVPSSLTPPRSACTGPSRGPASAAQSPDSEGAKTKAAARRRSDHRERTTSYSPAAEHDGGPSITSGLTQKASPQGAGAALSPQRLSGRTPGQLRSRALPDSGGAIACAAVVGTTVFSTAKSNNAASFPTDRAGGGRNRAQQVTPAPPRRSGRSQHKRPEPERQHLPDPTAQINAVLQQRFLQLRVTVPDDERLIERAQRCTGIHKLLSLLCDAADASGDDPLTTTEVITALTGLDRIGLTVVSDSDADMAVRQHRLARAGLSRDQLYQHDLAFGMDDIDCEIRGSPVVDRATTWAVTTAQLRRASTVCPPKCRMCHRVFDSRGDLIGHVELCRSAGVRRPDHDHDRGRGCSYPEDLAVNGGASELTALTSKAASTASPPVGDDDPYVVESAPAAPPGRLVLVARLRKLKVDYDGVSDHELQQLVRAAEEGAADRDTSTGSDAGGKGRGRST